MAVIKSRRQLISVPQKLMVVLLSDIRDELQALNATLGCRRFQAIPTRLQEISSNTKHRPRGPNKLKGTTT